MKSAHRELLAGPALADEMHRPPERRRPVDLGVDHAQAWPDRDPLRDLDSARGGERSDVLHREEDRSPEPDQRRLFAYAFIDTLAIDERTVAAPAVANRPAPPVIRHDGVGARDSVVVNIRAFEQLAPELHLALRDRAVGRPRRRRRALTWHHGRGGSP